MNYLRIYSEIVERGQTRTLKPSPGIEIHHIIPTCIGGSNDKSNLTALTPREHFICHRILVRLYPNNRKIATAFFMMSNMKRCKVSARAYEEAKEIYRANKIADKTKKTTKGYKYNFSDEHRINLSIAGKTRIHAKGYKKKDSKSYTERQEIVKKAQEHYLLTGEILSGTPLKIKCKRCGSYTCSVTHTRERCDKILEKRSL